MTVHEGFGRPRSRPLTPQERHQQREDARAERSFQQRQQRQQARAQQTQQAVADYRAGEREQRPPTPVEQHRAGERDSFLAPLSPVLTEANQIPVTMPTAEDIAWNDWLITEKWGTDLTTEQAVSLFLGYVTGNYDVEADDVATLQALEVIVRETVGDVIDTNSALYLLQQSGALDGRGFSAYTIDYLINQSSIVMGSGQTISQDIIDAVAPLGNLSADDLANLEALTGLTMEQANLVRNEMAWVQSTLVNELYAMVYAGVLSEDIFPYLNLDLDDPNSINLGILVALYQEGLEKAGAQAPYLHRPDSPMPVMFFASQTTNLYPPSSLDGEAFLFAMSFFPVLDQVAAAIDFIRSAAAGDRMGTGLALMGFLPGPNPGAFDDIVEGAARNADEIAPEEFADEILGIGGGTNPFAARTGREVSRSGFRNAVLDEYTRAGIGLDWLDDLPTGMVADVHHIVAWNSPLAFDARRILADSNIAHHNVLNGVVVPDILHHRLHTAPYYTAIEDSLQFAWDSNGADGVRQMMDDIAELVDGSSYDLVQRVNASELTEAEQIALVEQVRHELITAIANLAT